MKFDDDTDVDYWRKRFHNLYETKGYARQDNRWDWDRTGETKTAGSTSMKVDGAVDGAGKSGRKSRAQMADPDEEDDASGKAIAYNQEEDA